MKLALGSVGSLVLAVVAVACGGTDGTSAADSDITAGERGFSYECKTEKMFISADKTKVLVTAKHLSFEGDWGPNVGALDSTYRPPAGKKRVRYDGFETGEDCSMRVVADQALLDGQATGQVRIQCQGDDFQQEILDCSKPKPATYRAPAPPPPPEPVVTVPADAKKWSCKTTDGSAFADKLTMQISDAAITIQEEGEDFDRTGTRYREYKPRSGNWIAYDNVEYGGDCSITLVVDAKALSASTTSTTLKVRCAGDDFLESVYACK